MTDIEIKIELTELTNKLFMYTDTKDWDKLLAEVFTTEVWFDMSSAGGGAPAMLEAKAICDMWQEGLKDLDAVHHQAGHYLIALNGKEAAIYAYAMAAHYKKAAQKGNSRLFVGSYDLSAVETKDGWRLSAFKYNLKFIDGNQTLD